MLSGPIPAGYLRAAQFHEFVAQLVEWGRQGDMSYVPKMRTQLVAARTVAETLVRLPPAPNRRPYQDRTGHQSRRSPAHARKAWSRSPNWSRPGAVTRSRSRA
jgi:hypothetical protein